MNKSVIKEIIDGVKKLNDFKEKYKSKLPFHFNVIDELHANENAHSRIVARLFEYKEYNTHPFLESFFNRVGIGESVKQAIITVEKDRIDCLIKDENYAVISPPLTSSIMFD